MSQPHVAVILIMNSNMIKIKGTCLKYTACKHIGKWAQFHLTDVKTRVTNQKGELTICYSRK